MSVQLEEEVRGPQAAAEDVALEHRPLFALDVHLEQVHAGVAAPMGANRSPSRLAM